MAQWESQADLLELLPDSSNEQGSFKSPGGQAEATFDPLCQFLTGDSPAIRNVRNLVRRFSRSHAPVLITGPSGSGKEMVARALHYASHPDRPFVAVNTGAIPRELLESELFGHERGSFTGATSSREGRIEAAKNGTLMLDEIGDMPKDLQIKLLRVIENREFSRLGCDQTRQFGARIIFATHRDLREAVSDGTFREDLFWRINVLTVYVPPLSDRLQDLRALTRSISAGVPPDERPIFSSAAFRIMQHHPWQGNVRELRNFIERVSAYFPGAEPDPDDLLQLLRQNCANGLATSAESGGTEIEAAVRKSGLRETLLSLEAEIVRNALAKHANLSQTARALRMPRATLKDRMRKYSLSPEQWV